MTQALPPRFEWKRLGTVREVRATIAIPPGTHQVEAQLVDMRSRPISTSLPAQVKVTMDNLGD